MIDRIPETPLRRSTLTEDAISSSDSSEVEETIATLPVYLPLPPGTTQPTQLLYTQNPTQPTQLIDRSNTQKSSLPRSSSTVQVPTSSPLTQTSRNPNPVPGALSTSIAPPGTRFQPPPMIQPVKRTPVIDIDSDGPTYRGGSSDDEPPRINDIKPSTFINGSRNSEKERIPESPVGANKTGRFSEIVAAAFYKPTAGKPPGKRLAGVTQDPPAKRPRSHPVSPEPEPMSLMDIPDYNLRVKVERMRNVFTNKSIRVCFDALMEKRGNYEDAVDYIGQLDDALPNLTTSEDELSLDTTTKLTIPAATAKQQIKASTRIQDKWTSRTVNQKSIPKENDDNQTQPRRRLMKGVKNRQVSPVSSPVRTVPKKVGRLIQGRKSRSRQPSESPELSVVDLDSDSDSAGEESQDDSDLQDKVLQFFNSCSEADLADIAELTPDLAKLFISARPFKSLTQARKVSTAATESRTKARTTKKAIGDKVVDKCLDMWTGYEAIDALVKKCEALGKPVFNEMKKWGVDVFGAKTNGELELMSLDKSFHDSGVGTPISDTGSSSELKLIGQPSIMSKDIKLKDYQVVGINWLNLLFDQKLSCILADDMGLGKTCQVIAFLASLFEKGVTGPHLIVVPSSTLENWLREFSVFCPALTVMPYYAGLEERANIREQIEKERDQINVVITTYTIAKAKVDAAFLRTMNFCACVYDEGHVLKSSKSQVYSKLIRIPAQFRLLLTGTPLQNNLQELASLLGFILPKVFAERKDDLEYIFSAKAKTVDIDQGSSALLSAQRIARAKSMLSPFVLRRKKHQVIDLPAKTTRVEYCTMNDAQRDIYTNETETVRKIIAERAGGKTVNKSTNILMKLRQAAIHPLFYRRHYDDKTLSRMSKACLKDPKWSMSNADVIYDELTVYSDLECHQLCTSNPDSLGKFVLKNDEWMQSGKIDKLCELLEEYIENGDRILIFSQFTMVMDILEMVLETLQIRFFRLDGTTSVEDRQSILDAFYEQVEIPVFMLSTKAGGAGINLACANKVIIFDSSFNPQDDIQAENRAHRVGQTREVEVVRLVTKDTIEEQIYALGQTKLVLDQRVAGEEENSKKSEDAGIRAVESMVIANLEGEKTKEEN